MKYPNFFETKNSLNLFGLKDNFRFISDLYSKKNLPKVLMLTGNKGTGKSTIINHFLYSIFDTDNYNKDTFSLSENSIFLKKFQNNIFSNIIYINGTDYKSVKIDDIRYLKKQILQSSISDKDRFIIFDDIELFNQNSLNALLKIIEEPSQKNYFFLINNKEKLLIETIKSRALEIKIILNERQRLEIINKLASFYKLELILDPNSSQLSPGNFVKFNYICKEYNILPLNNFIENLSLLLDLYKKKKDILLINLVIYLMDQYLNHIKVKKSLANDKIFEIKNYIIENLNNFIFYNINQNSFINAVNEKLNHE
tara:strand:+ start:509 stop:1444 length:936 start_codon:yes stop_codon:yes gene_type:complete